MGALLIRASGGTGPMVLSASDLRAPFALAACKALQIALPETLRLPTDLSVADLEAADHVVAVKEAEHAPLVARRFPEWSSKIEFWHVHDLDCATPDVAIPHLELEVTRLIERLAA